MEMANEDIGAGSTGSTFLSDEEADSDVDDVNDDDNDDDDDSGCINSEVVVGGVTEPEEKRRFEPLKEISCWCDDEARLGTILLLALKAEDCHSLICSGLSLPWLMLLVLHVPV